MHVHSFPTKPYRTEPNLAEPTQVVDSVAALVPKAELDGDMGDHHIALQARLMSQALRKLTGAISKTKCLLIFINQIRQKVGVIFGSNEVTTGGTALRFYSSVRSLPFRRIAGRHPTTHTRHGGLGWMIPGPRRFTSAPFI
jgi:protein RecA